MSAPDPTAESDLRLTVSMSRKVNLGNFESADCFVAISGVRAGMSAEEMIPLMETGRVAWEQVRAALVEQVRKTKAERAGGT